MKIAFDIDDTLTKTTDLLLEYILKYNHEYNNLLYQNRKTMYKDLTGIKECDDFLRKYMDEIAYKVKLNKNSKEIIDLLIKEGHTIYFITARNNKLFSDAEKITKEYLKSHNISYHKLITNAGRKLNHIINEQIDIFFDDNYDTIKDIHKHNYKCYLFNGRNNYDIKTNIKRISSWNEIYDVVNNIQND